MEYGYIIKISNKNLYKEIQLPIDKTIIKIGMDMECDVRLYKENFFEKFMLTFSKNNDVWSIACSKNIYIDAGDVRKLLNKELKHGDKFTIRYQESGNSVFEIEFVFDFDNKERKYNRKIDISNVQRISIGNGKENSIALNSPYIKNDQIFLDKNGDKLELKVVCTTYGVYHNGKKVNASETIENGDFISIADFSFYYKDNIAYTEVDGNIEINNLIYVDEIRKNEYPKFNRNTRIKLVVNDEKIEIMDPPAKPQKPKDNLFVRLLPSFGMLAASGVMAFMGGTMIIFSAISGGMAIVTSIIGVVQNKKQYKLQKENRVKIYTQYINEKENEIQNIREVELADLQEKYISLEEEKNNFEKFSSNLFDRRLGDQDFLNIRLGEGKVEALRKINYKKKERLEIEDDLQKMPETITKQYKYIYDAPIICDLKEINALGILGEEENRFEIFKNIIIDICARHYKSDVKMFFIAEEKNKDRIFWLRMLPYVYHQTVGIRNIVCDDEGKNLIFEYLYKELSFRESTKKYENELVVFFYDEYGFKNHPISKFVENAKDLGVTFLFFEDKKKDVPQGCGYLIDLQDDKTAILINTENKNDFTEFTYPNISTRDAKKIVNNLAPIYTEEISLESTLTKNITLYQLLNILSVDDINLKERWQKSKVFISMSAPLGVSKTGIVCLDLHDKAHGPHGLVAGTTGSGKSEILQTYILSMATLFHPYEVSFVIIDFKGGGMVNQFANLPHLLGAITNIDGKEINRSLKSIKAELQKRQKLFAELEVNHIDKYIKKYQEGIAKKPLPHLIIIVDEFAELKAEQPEFMKELISAARIGRSLGVHLILATQKPSGQVNEQIWSNSKFKLCLKVQSQEDSNEVLKSPLAAEIKEPGRAYLQVGNNEIFELFQSAYSGAPEKENNSNIKEFEIFSLTASGKKKSVFARKKNKIESHNLTQLEALVKYVEEYCYTEDIVKLPNICLPPLEDVIKIEEVKSEYDLSNIPIGIYDDPDTQYQGPAKINLCNENVVIIGSSQTGKTNLIQVLVRLIVEKYSPKEINFYIVDFGAMYLKNYSNLNHVGGVVTASEEERIKNLFKLLSEEIDFRKEKFMQIGLSSFAAYKEAGYDDLAQIIFIIDNFSAFKELYGDIYEDVFIYITREGITCGITVVLTNAQTNGIGFKYMSNFACKLALTCNDSNEYGMLFDRCRIEPKDVPGRMLCIQNKTIYELQSFLAFEGKKEIDRSNAVKQFIESINQKYTSQYAKKIPAIPDKLTLEFLHNNYNLLLDRYKYPIALDYSDVDVVYLELNKVNEYCLIGKDIDKKQFVLDAILMSLAKRILTNPVQMYIIDSIERPLKEKAELGFVEKYTIDYSEIGNVLEEIYLELERRYSLLMESGLDSIRKMPFYFIVINNPEVIEYVSNTKELMEIYSNMLKKYKALGFVFLYSNIDDTNVGYNSPEILKKLKDNKKGIITSDIKEFKFCDIPSNIVRNSKQLGYGDAYLMDGSDVKRIKVIEED